MLFGGIVVAVEIAAAAAGSEPLVIPYDDWYRDLRRTAWSAGTVRAVLIALVVLGAVLVLLQLLRRRPESLPVRSPDAYERYAVHRRGLEGTLRRAAESVDGVDRARARVGRTRVNIVAHASHRTNYHARVGIEQAVQRRLDDAELDAPLDLQVELREKTKQ